MNLMRPIYRLFQTNFFLQYVRFALFFLKVAVNFASGIMFAILRIIINMTKLLDADWLRGVQLFHSLYCSTINDFPKTNKMAERYFYYSKDKCEIKLPLRN
jgi:hypothetical protein